MKAQAAMEYLIIVAIVLAAIAPLFNFVITSSVSQIKLNKADNSVKAIAESANNVFTAGPGSREFVKITLPSGVKSFTATNNEIKLEVDVYGQKQEVVATTLAPLNGNLPTNEGIHHIAIGMGEDGYVKIYTLASVTTTTLSGSTTTTTSTTTTIAGTTTTSTTLPPCIIVSQAGGGQAVTVSCDTGYKVTGCAATTDYAINDVYPLSNMYQCTARTSGASYTITNAYAFCCNNIDVYPKSASGITQQYVSCDVGGIVTGCGLDSGGNDLTRKTQDVAALNEARCLVGVSVPWPDGNFNAFSICTDQFTCRTLIGPGANGAYAEDTSPSCDSDEFLTDCMAYTALAYKVEDIYPDIANKRCKAKLAGTSTTIYARARCCKLGTPPTTTTTTTIPGSTTTTTISGSTTTSITSTTTTTLAKSCAIRSNSGTTSVSRTCNAGERVTGCGASINNQYVLRSVYPTSNTACNAVGTSGASITVYAHCCTNVGTNIYSSQGNSPYSYTCPSGKITGCGAQITSGATLKTKSAATTSNSCTAAHATDVVSSPITAIPICNGFSSCVRRAGGATGGCAADEILTDCGADGVDELGLYAHLKSVYPSGKTCYGSSVDNLNQPMGTNVYAVCCK